MTQIMEIAALDKAINIIKKFEGCRLNAYRCPAGIWTIGWGETRGVKKGDIWTQGKADEMLETRVKEFMEAVLLNCPELEEGPDNRIAACTSLAYNIGISAFAGSTVCRMIRQNEHKRAADAFLLWNKAAGRILPGLTRRRQAERKLYLGEQ